MFLLAYNGMSFKCAPNIFLNRGLLAAHYLMSSPQGNVRIVTAKKSKNTNLTRLCHVHKRDKRLK